LEEAELSHAPARGAGDDRNTEAACHDLQELVDIVRLEGNAADSVKLGEGSVVEAADGPVTPKVREALVCNFAEPNRLSLRESVTFETGEQHRLVVYLDHLNGVPNALGNRVDETKGGEVEPPIADRLEQLDRAGLMQLDVEMRMLGREAFQGVGDLDVKCFAGTDADPSGEQARHGTDSRASHIGGGERSARLGKQRTSGVGEVDLASGAHEKRRAELALQRAHRGGNRRLRHIESPGGAGEMPLFCNRDEMFETSEFDQPILSRRSIDRSIR
jgi:hypothetical protein